MPDAAEPGELQTALRRAFSRAVVRAKDPLATFGSFGPDIWYCYRDGRLTAQDEEARWWEADSVAHVVIDQSNRYVEANAAACALLGVAPGGLHGRRWSEFAAPGAEEDAEWLRQSLQRHGNGFSTFSLLRKDGSALDIEYHCVVYARGESILYETAMREYDAERPAARQRPLQALSHDT